MDNDKYIVSQPDDKLWRHRDFLKLWSGQVVSLLGDQISLLAIPLLAVLILHANAVQMGLLTAMGSVPAVLFALIAGVWIDRFRRRPLLVMADLGRFLLLCVIPSIYVFGMLRIEILYVLMFGVGTLAIFFNVAYPSYVPALLTPKLLVEGNSRLELSRSLVLSLGPALAGLLIQLLSAPVAIVFDACSFLISALSVAWIRTPELRVRGETRHNNMGQEIKDGLSFVLNSPLLRAITGSYAMLALFNSLLEAIFVLYLIRDIGIQPVLLGLIFALGSSGFVVGALLCGRLTAWLGLGHVLLLAPIVIGLSDMLCPLAATVPHVCALFLICLAQFGFGLAYPLFNINQLSLRQALTPARLQGRMHASISLLTYGLPTLGALLGGALGQFIGLPQTLVIAATGEICSCVWMYFSPIRTLQEHPHLLVEQASDVRF